LIEFLSKHMNLRECLSKHSAYKLGFDVPKS
jgi:hypothetical protein